MTYLVFAEVNHPICCNYISILKNLQEKSLNFPLSQLLLCYSVSCQISAWNKSSGNKFRVTNFHGFHAFICYVFRDKINLCCVEKSHVQ